jgi:TRAP-type uncharacterized transport system substrate-binding protein
VGTENFAIGAAGLPDAVAAAVTLAAMKNRAALAAAVPAASGALSAGVMESGVVAYHPGALAVLKGMEG